MIVASVVLVRLNIALIRKESRSSGVLQKWTNHFKVKPWGGKIGYALVPNAVAITTTIGAKR
jgi:hypothetical protein